MIHYIIDGNNLIGKIKTVKDLQNKNKQASRESLVSILTRYFAGKKVKLTLHFDGYPNGTIPFIKGRIVYSEKHNSDYMIKEEIDHSKNPKLLTIVSSDHGLINYARANSCAVMKSEALKNEIFKALEKNEEAEKVRQLENEKDIFIKLFSKS